MQPGVGNFDRWDIMLTETSQSQKDKSFVIVLMRFMPGIVRFRGRRVVVRIWGRENELFNENSFSFAR